MMNECSVCGKTVATLNSPREIVITNGDAIGWVEVFNVTCRDCGCSNDEIDEYAFAGQTILPVKP